MKTTNNFVELLMDYRWLRHLLFWIIIVIYFTIGFGYRNGQFTPIPSLKSTLRFLPGFLLVVYPLLYLLIPRFLVKKKFGYFLAGYLACICLAAINTYLLNSGSGLKENTRSFDLRIGSNLLPYIHVSGLATAVKMGKNLFVQQDRLQVSQQQKAEAELQLLKAQIHPHFLFNTLNNLFAHTLQSSPEASRIVLKLSELLRFMIYESQAEFIPLKQEVQLLENYVNLERLRYGPDLLLSHSFTGDLENQRIRPLLLLPLVENCFKHGTSQQLGQRWIKVELHVTNNKLHFMLANSRDPDQNPVIIPGKTKGIGLENVKRRLALLYPGDHFFELRPEPDMFQVNMSITLDKVQAGTAINENGGELKHTAA